MFKKLLLFSAALTSTIVNATTYATFYSDPSCTENASVDFSVNNPGCFSAGSNEYVKYHGTNVQCFSLVKSPDASCPCQFDCITGLSNSNAPVPDCAGLIIPEGNCYYVGQHESLRFIGGKCPSNDCPDRSSRSIPTLEDYEDEHYQEDKYYDDSNSEQEQEQEQVSEQVSEDGDILEQTVDNVADGLTDAVDSPTSPALDRRDYGVPGVGYYRMCKDKYCTLDCSINFRTTDPGCINGGDFKSLQLPGGLGSTSTLQLVGTPHPGCVCQDACWNVQGPSCMELPDDMKNKGSYRMIQQGSCDSNNC
ncbi:hypothetical protein E3P92_03050 [Wallemia ichthyophaga]|uniref:Secreted protein n=1 Tax=Wallemia ichthyophaga TaxID=245174 RepID=A0A4T0I0U7_WALIC|nr:hypothetical protein E3P98_03050 [Wallemia ichthyophaga]TIA94524.1 hypothetical protein E3P96_04144 [Wallemia ichthyophaga]TIA97173.1 hypothetical protein E3P95_02937 [Wallemia ichthyophaga]TIA98424.1 hypothetical protein E3P94_02938 [Wallemia ichthyophaga]TIB10037.1 hypothetical protein E3P90_02978 [Wallemia ichthyophaga]